MRGALYAITEILVFLVLATLIGFLIGRWYAALRGGGAGGSSPESEAATPPANERLTALEAELATARSRSEEIEKELSMARWQIGTLEDELAKRPEANDGG